MHQRLGRFVAGIQVHRADQRLQRIGQDGRALLPTGAGLAFAQVDRVGQVELEGQAVQGVLLDEVRAHARELAFALRTQACIQEA